MKNLLSGRLRSGVPVKQLELLADIFSQSHPYCWLMSGWGMQRQLNTVNNVTGCWLHTATI
ncbi:hypothetical protein OH492_19130 [Vibrio chagasii]|nr:hypothetical protein [Vibrio chagasii]